MADRYAASVASVNVEVVVYPAARTEPESRGWVRAHSASGVVRENQALKES